MSYTTGQVKALVRSLVDDPSGSWANDNFVLPIMNEVYNDANAQLVSTQTSWDISVVEVPGVVPGTPNLGPLQVGTGLLATLTDQPIRIDWKPAGEDPSYYELVPNFDVLPYFQPQETMPGWEYRQSVIWLGPSSIAVDLNIRGEFGPPPLTADDSVLVSHPPVSYTHLDVYKRQATSCR